MSESLAERATAFQGDKPYVGRDEYQNGVLDRSNDRIYVAGWNENWGSSTGSSGYFTDKSTIDSCMDGSSLNTNQLDGALQTKLSDWGTSDGSFQAHSHVSAYDIDYGRLDNLESGTDEEKHLHEQLTNPDGMSPGNSEIKTAYGQAQANPQNGVGGGNQYYMDPDTMRDAIDKGVFKYNNAESFSTDGSTGKNINRDGVSRDNFGAYTGGKFDNDMRKAQNNEDIRQSNKENERLKSGQTEAEQINSQTVKTDPDKPYIAKPDPAYGYGIGTGNAHNNTTINTGGHTQNNAVNVNGTHAPPTVGSSGAAKRSSMPTNVSGSSNQYNSSGSQSGMPAKAVNGNSYGNTGPSPGISHTASGYGGSSDSGQSSGQSRGKGMGM